MIGSTVNIGVNMFLRDQFTGPSRRITGASKLMQQQLRTLRDEAENLRFARNFNAGLALVGAGAIRSMVSAINKGADFWYTMESVRAVTESTNKEMVMLGNVANKLGRDTMFFGKDVAEAMNVIAKAGSKARELPGLTTGAVYLAGATDTKLEGELGAADIMVSISKMFDASAASSMRISDVLTRAVNDSNIELSHLAETIKYTGTTANLLNLSLEETAAMAMVAGNAGLKGSIAGTSIENMLRYLNRAITNPTGKQKKSLESVGLTGKEFIDKSGNIVKPSKVFETLNNALMKTFGEGNTVYKQGVLEGIFGVRGQRFAGLALRFTEEYNNALNDLMTNSTGLSERITRQKMDSLKGHLDRVASTFESIRNSFTKGLEPALKVILAITENVGEVINKVMDIPFLGPMISTLIAKALVVKTVTWAWRAATAGLQVIMRSMGNTMMTTASQTVSGYGAMTMAANKFNLASMIGLKNAQKARIIQTGLATGPQFRDALTGKFIGGALASRYLRRFGVGAAAGAGAFGLFKSLGPLAKIGGKGILSFLGMTSLPGLLINIITWLPMIIGAIKGNSDSNDENSDKLDETNKSLDRLSYRTMPQDRSNVILDPTLAAIAYMDKRAGKLEYHQKDKPSVNVAIQVDGETKMKKVIADREKAIIRNSIGVTTF